MLLSPNGFLSEYVLKFNFEATNNMVEYEVLLLGLQLALEQMLRPSRFTMILSS